MSASTIPDAQRNASEEQTTVQKMLLENGQLIETIAEYQRIGRPADAMRYHELLHKNLIFLGNLVDPQLAQQVQNIRQPLHAAVSDTSTSNGMPVVAPSTSTIAGPHHRLPSPQQPVAQMSTSNGVGGAQFNSYYQLPPSAHPGHMPLSHPSQMPGPSGSQPPFVHPPP